VSSYPYTEEPHVIALLRWIMATMSSDPDRQGRLLRVLFSSRAVDFERVFYYSSRYNYECDMQSSNISAWELDLLFLQLMPSYAGWAAVNKPSSFYHHPITNAMHRVIEIVAAHQAPEPQYMAYLREPALVAIRALLPYYKLRTCSIHFVRNLLDSARGTSAADAVFEELALHGGDMMLFDDDVLKQDELLRTRMLSRVRELRQAHLFEVACWISRWSMSIAAAAADVRYYSHMLPHEIVNAIAFARV
jgi:hypothetical protein